MHSPQAVVAYVQRKGQMPAQSGQGKLGKHLCFNISPRGFPLAGLVAWICRFGLRPWWLLAAPAGYSPGPGERITDLHLQGM